MNPQLDKCRNGHFKTEATQYVNPKTNKSACRLCKQEHGKLAREMQKLRDKRALERVRGL